MTSLAFVLYSLLIAFFLYCLLNLRTLLFNRHPRPLPPGPKPWPVIGNLPHLGTMPHHSIATMARTYGPLMHLRLGLVDVVVAASASVAAQFLKTHDANFSSRPPTPVPNILLITIRTLFLHRTVRGGACFGKSAPSISSPPRPWMIFDTSDRSLSLSRNVLVFNLHTDMHIGHISFKMIDINIGRY